MQEKERGKCLEEKEKSIRAINGFMKAVSAITDCFNKERSSVFQA